MFSVCYVDPHLQFWLLKIGVLLLLCSGILFFLWIHLHDICYVQLVYLDCFCVLCSLSCSRWWC